MRLLLVILTLIASACGDDNKCFTKNEKCIKVVLVDAGADAP